MVGWLDSSGKLKGKLLATAVPRELREPKPPPKVASTDVLVQPSIRYILIFIGIMLLSTPAMCWGPTGHTLITSNAIELLPDGMKPFYETNSRYIVALTTLPDDWKHTHGDEAAPDHYIDLDLLSQPPFADLIADRKTVEDRFGKEKVLEAGVLPWMIVERYGKLVNAFKKQDMVEIVVQSALISHFIGDANVPFHATQFYDGKTSAQKGIHNRWEEILPALMLKPESIKPTSPEKVTDIRKSAFDWCISSYKQLDAIFAADDKARKLDPGYAYKYYQTLYNDTGSILKGRISSAAEAVAGVYLAAWVDAGKPTLPDKAAPLFWGH